MLDFYPYDNFMKSTTIFSVTILRMGIQILKGEVACLMSHS